MHHLLLFLAVWIVISPSNYPPSKLIYEAKVSTIGHFHLTYRCGTEQLVVHHYIDMAKDPWPSKTRLNVVESKTYYILKNRVSCQLFATLQCFLGLYLASTLNQDLTSKIIRLVMPDDWAFPRR